MIGFIIGVFIGAFTFYLFSKSVFKGNTQSVEQTPKSTLEYRTPSVQEDYISETNVDIPVEILPNLYSLSISNISMKHHIQIESGKSSFDYVTFKFQFSYQLNGRREGKRRLIVTSYDSDGGVIEVKGEYDIFRFTEAGVDVMEVCFNKCDKSMPKKISVMVREGTKE